MSPSLSVEQLRKVTPGIDGGQSSVPNRFFDFDLQELQLNLRGFELRRYGMPLRELTSIIHDTRNYAGFSEKFGISLEEYAERFLCGESMGLALKDGRFQPADSGSIAARHDRGNLAFIERLIGELTERASPSSHPLSVRAGWLGNAVKSEASS